VPGGLGPGVRGQHHVFVDQQGRIRRQLQLGLPEFAEIAHRGGGDGERAVVADLADLDAVVAVILDFQAQRLGLERHAGILGHQDHGALGLVAQVERGGDDAVVGGVDLHEDGADAIGTGAVEMVADQRLVDDHAQLAAVAQLGVERAGTRRIAFGDLLQRTVLEEGADGAVHAARAGAELAGLGLQPVKFGEHLHRDRHGVLVELEEGFGIVNQYVGVQDVSLFHVDDCRPDAAGMQTQKGSGGETVRQPT
jgi:hypothetical protein